MYAPSSPTYDFAAASLLFDLSHPQNEPKPDPEPTSETGTDHINPLDVMFYEDPVSSTKLTSSIVDDCQHDHQVNAVLMDLGRRRFPHVNIATMTLNYSTSIKGIDMKILREALKKEEVIALGAVVNEKQFSGVNVAIKKGLIAVNKISIMFFRSGQVTIAGPKTMAEANLSAQHAVRVLQLCSEAYNKGADEPHITIVERNIRMINLSIKTTLSVNLEVIHAAVSKYTAVKSAIVKKGGLHFFLRTDDSSEHMVNVRIFGSGSINVSSVLNARQMGRALLFTHKVLDDMGYDLTTAHAADKCAVRIPKKRGRKSKAEIAMCLADALASVQAIKKQRVV